MHSIVLGIDVSKANLHLALLQNKGKPQKRQVSNDEAGFAKITRWLIEQGVSQVHVCLEATNTYGNAVARYLHQQVYQKCDRRSCRVCSSLQLLITPSINFFGARWIYGL